MASLYRLRWELYCRKLFSCFIDQISAAGASETPEVTMALLTDRKDWRALVKASF